MKKITIVIVHYSGIKDTEECLESIEKLETRNYQLQVVVVDNSLKEEFKNENIKIIRNKENLGFAGGNNVGIKYALEHGADYILLLNNDTIVDRNLVNELVKVAQSQKRIGVVAPKIYFAKGYEFHKNRYKKEDLGKVFWYAGGIMDWKNIYGYHRGVDEVDQGQYQKIEQTEFASGCCILIKKEVLRDVGLLDEKYFLYYEDSDFCERAKKAGYIILYVPKAVLWHKNAGAAGGSGSTLQDYYITRNRMLFSLRYAPFKSKLALIRESFYLLIKGRQWQKRGIIDYYFNRLGIGSYLI